MSSIPLLSGPASAEASQLQAVVNGVIQQINANALIGSVAPTSLRNIVIGGDFSTNPWQRGTSFAAIANTATFTADRFYALGGASSSIAVSQQTTTLPGFSKKLRFQRTAANADTTAITLNYIVAAEDVQQMQGLPFVLSFWAQAGSTFSAASSTLGVSVSTGTTADEGHTAYSAGTWTGVASITLTGSAGTTATGVTLTTAWQRFALTGVVGSTIQELGFTFSFTPVGTAGANDYVEFAGIQLEVMPQGGVNPTPFERRPVQLERQLCQRYTQVITETTGTSTEIIAVGNATSTTVATVGLPVAVPFRVAPTPTFPTTGGFVLMAAQGTKTGTIGFTQFSTFTTKSVPVTATAASGLTIANIVTLAGTGQGASIVLNAEL